MKYAPPMLSAARFRRKLLDGLVQAAIDQEQVALRIHRERPAGIRTGVGDGRLAVPVELHDRAMLRNEGYTHWGKIELDDDDEVWEVDNAYASVSNFGQRIANFSRFPGFDVVNPLVHKNGAAI